jgi:hypothetical protein
MTGPLYVDDYAWNPEDGPATLDQLAEERERELQDERADREFCDADQIWVRPESRFL